MIAFPKLKEVTKGFLKYNTHFKQVISQRVFLYLGEKIVLVQIQNSNS